MIGLGPIQLPKLLFSPGLPRTIEQGELTHRSSSTDSGDGVQGAPWSWALPIWPTVHLKREVQPRQEWADA